MLELFELPAGWRQKVSGAVKAINKVRPHLRPAEMSESERAVMTFMVALDLLEEVGKCAEANTASFIVTIKSGRFIVEPTVIYPQTASTLHSIVRSVVADVIIDGPPLIMHGDKFEPLSSSPHAWVHKDQ